MTDKRVINPRTNVVYKVEAESEDGYLWTRRVSDGTLDTIAARMLVPYEPVPAVGEIWVDLLGQDVVIVGYDAVAEQYITVPVQTDAWGESAIQATAYPREELFAKPLAPPTPPEAPAPQSERPVTEVGPQVGRRDA